MKDDNSKCGRQFLLGICIDQEYELSYWSWRFGVNKKQLIEAVDAVGTSAADVEKHLKDCGNRFPERAYR